MDKPPLFFIHGMWATPSVWDRLKALISRHADMTATRPRCPFTTPVPATPPDPLLASVGIDDYVDALIAAAREVGASAGDRRPFHGRDAGAEAGGDERRGGSGAAGAGPDGEDAQPWRSRP